MQLRRVQNETLPNETIFLKKKAQEMAYKYTEKEYVEKDKKYIFHSWGFSPLVQAEGKGCILRDINGKEYIDCLSQMANSAGVGISHPKVVKAVKDQVEKLACGMAWCVNIPRVELAEKLAKITTRGLKIKKSFLMRQSLSSR